MTKPTKEQMKARAWAIAESHFYSDDECKVPWEPFENWDEDDITEQVADMAKVIFNAMVWAQGDGGES